MPAKYCTVKGAVQIAHSKPLPSLGQPTNSVNLIVLKDYGNFKCYPSKSAKDLFILTDKIINMEVKVSTG